MSCFYSRQVTLREISRGRAWRDRQGRRDLAHRLLGVDQDEAKPWNEHPKHLRKSPGLSVCVELFDTIAEMTSPPAQLSLCCTTMLRKFGKTVREKLDHIESRADQPGPHSSSRDGGNNSPTPGDFPTQGDFLKFRKQRGVNLGCVAYLPYQMRLVSNCFQARGLCWRGGLQIIRFGKLTRRGKVISTLPVGHAPERFCRTIGEIGSLKMIGPG